MLDAAMNIRQKMTQLARTFPTFAADGPKGLTPGLDPFDAVKLWDHAKGWSHGEQCAARFVLSVWDPAGNPWYEKFDLHEALGVWDSRHLMAFIAWAVDPWWG
jgi:hypothetical protein